MTAPGATFLACERGRWRQLVDGRLNRFVGQAGGMFGNFDHPKRRALLFEGGRCFEPLRSAGIQFQTLAGLNVPSAITFLLVLRHTEASNCIDGWTSEPALILAG